MPKNSAYSNTTKHTGIRRNSLLCILLLSFGLGACSDEERSQAEAAVTLTPELAQLFRQTCANCHTQPITTAPQSGDRQAWQKILAKGMDITLERTINGYGGMPPGGQCFECTPEDLRQLILFMSQSASDRVSPSKNNGAKS